MFINEQSKVYKEENFEIVCTQISKLKNVQNWSRNRPADLIRIEQIKHYYIVNNIILVPGIIYIWKNNNGLFIYDGLHRFLAASQSMKCIVKYNYNTESNVISDFENINMSVSLPSLYVESDSKLKRIVCEDIVKRLCEKYKKFVSPIRKPHKPNFNRDNTIEIISSLTIDFTKNNINNIVYDKLILLNNSKEAQNYISENNISITKKCEQYEFYLFYLSNDFILKSIENDIN